MGALGGTSDRHEDPRTVAFASYAGVRPEEANGNGHERLSRVSPDDVHHRAASPQGRGKPEPGGSPTRSSSKGQPGTLRTAPSRRRSTEEALLAHDRPWLVIIPSDENTPYQLWEAFSMFLVFLSAYFIPYDLLVVSEDEDEPDTIRYFNLLMDITFTADILLHFRIAFKKGTQEASEYETDWRAIAKRYCSFPPSVRDSSTSTGLFWIDVSATLPSWLTRANFLHGDAARALRCIRLVRLLRVLRLVDRAQKLTSMLGLNLRVLEASMTFVCSTLTFHWMACIWIAQEPTPRDDDECIGECAYREAVYWSVVTLTGTGYGDQVAEPTVASYLMCSLLMFVSAFVWAGVVGAAISIIAELSRNNNRFSSDLSDLIAYCDEREVGHQLKREARIYMVWSKDGPKRNDQDLLLQHRFSQELLGEVKRWNRGGVFESVRWAQNIGNRAIAELCNKMSREYFGKYESCIGQRTLIYVKQGRVRINLETLSEGQAWGEKRILLLHDECIYSRTLDHLDCLLLHQDSLKEVCDEIPWVGVSVRRVQVRLLVSRAISRIAKAIRKRKLLVERGRSKSPVRHDPVIMSFSGPRDAGKFDAVRQQAYKLAVEMVVIAHENWETEQLVREQAKLARQLTSQLKDLQAEEGSKGMTPPGGPWGTATRC